MSITTNRGSGQRYQRQRKQMRSHKSDSAITAARRAGIQLVDYRHHAIYLALKNAGYVWNGHIQEWEAPTNE